MFCNSGQVIGQTLLLAFPIHLNFALAYQGGLITSLTYPARSKAIDTFEDLLQLPEEATIGTYPWSSMDEILKESTDTTLQVLNEHKVFTSILLVFARLLAI